jgi:predicted 3-demethylubiquinone-9 3-methyltransferase (glyoxalase superfamily)
MAEITSNGKIQPFIVFDGCAQEAINAYVGLFPKSSIEKIALWPAGGPFTEGHVQYAGFNLCGLNIMAMDAVSAFAKSDAMSLFVHCRDQAEVDKYYDFLCEGGTAKPCGWVTDKYGLSWQIIPIQFNQMMSGGTPKQVHAVLQAMMLMKKMNIDELQHAFANSA